MRKLQYPILIVAAAVSLTVSQRASAAPTWSTQSQQDAIEQQCKKATRLDSAAYYCDAIARYLAPMSQAQLDGATANLQRPPSVPVAFAQVIELKSIEGQVATAIQFEAQRLDQEEGAPPSADGSTNLVSKPGAAQLLSLAVQSGALTQTTSGDTTTVEGNLDQIVRFVGGTQPALVYTNHGTPVLQNISIYSTLTMNAASASSIPVSGSATSSSIPSTTATTPSTAVKLQSFTARYQYNNKYDPKSAAFQRAYAAALGSLASASGAGGSLASYFTNENNCTAYAQSDSVADTIKKFDSCTDTFIKNAADPATGAAASLTVLATAAADLTKIMAGNTELYRQAIATAAGIPFTFEYVYNRPQNQPDEHDFRGIVAWNAGAGMLNANFDASIYGTERPADASYGRLKDIQFAAEFDRAISANSKTSPYWSVAAYGQWQGSPSVITLTSTSVPSGITLPPNAQSFITGTKGFLAVVQGKFTFKVGGSQIPLAVKWSNKTELLDKKTFGGEFGLTYDLSQLKQLFGGSS